MTGAYLEGFAASLSRAALTEDVGKHVIRNDGVGGSNPSCGTISANVLNDLPGTYCYRRYHPHQICNENATRDWGQSQLRGTTSNDREPADRDHHENRVRVRLHSGQSKPAIDTSTTRAEPVRFSCEASGSEPVSISIAAPIVTRLQVPLGWRRAPIPSNDRHLAVFLGPIPCAERDCPIC